MTQLVASDCRLPRRREDIGSYLALQWHPSFALRRRRAQVTMPMAAATTVETRMGKDIMACQMGQ